MQYNPYEYMLMARNNRVLFQYLEISAVNFNEEHGWTITGQTKEGKTEIYETTNGILRFTLPISIPDFVTIDILQRILEGLQGNIEGLVTAAEDEDGLYIEYHLHSLPDFEYLDPALLKFVQERSEINQGFASLEVEYKKMEKAVGNISENIADMLDKQSKQAPEQKPSKGGRPTDEADLSSLWNDMENVDTKNNNNINDDNDDTVPPWDGDSPLQ